MVKATKGGLLGQLTEVMMRGELVRRALRCAAPRCAALCCAALCWSAGARLPAARTCSDAGGGPRAGARFACALPCPCLTHPRLLVAGGGAGC